MNENKKQTAQNQWQGFQQFCESSNSIEMNQNYTQNNQETSKNNKKSKRQSQIDIRGSPIKKKTKIKQINCVNNCKANMKQLQAQQKPINKPQSPKKQYKPLKKFERIPIMRRDQDYRNTSNMVYRNFAPRSSQTYFKTLKHCELTQYTTTNKFKQGQNFIFNSKFESGNLSAAFQGIRKLV